MVKKLLYILVFIITMTVSKSAFPLQLNMEDVDLQSFVKVVGHVLNKTIIMDKNIQGSVTISSNAELTADNALNVLVSILSSNHYVLESVDDDILRVVPLQEASASITTIRKGVVTAKVFNLSNITLPDAKTIITTLYGKQVKVTEATPSTIVVTGTPMLLAKIGTLIQVLDIKNVPVIEILNLNGIPSKRALSIVQTSIPTLHTFVNGQSLLVTGSKRDVVLAEKMVDQMLDIGDVNIPIYKFAVFNADIHNILKSIKSLKALSPNSELVADERTHTLTLYGNKYDHEIVKEYLANVDTPVPQLLIEALILEASGVDTLDTGVSFSRASAKLNVGAGGANVTTKINDTLQALSIGMFNNNPLAFGVLARLLKTHSKVRVLSKPSIRVMSGEKASIMIGQNIPIITTNSQGANGANPFQTLDRKDVGLKLTIMPVVRPNNIIDLKLKQELSSVTNNTAAADVVFNKRELSTRLLTTSGNVSIMGGLLKKSKDKTRDGIPVLMDIPLLGKIFSHDITTNKSTDLVLFLKATIVNNGNIKLLPLLKEEQHFNIVNPNKE